MGPQFARGPTKDADGPDGPDVLETVCVSCLESLFADGGPPSWTLSLLSCRYQKPLDGGYRDLQLTLHVAGVSEIRVLAECTPIVDTG